MKLSKYILSASVLFSSLASYAVNDYCIALRGNGELIPAHWGSLAKVIETYGEPRRAAGGSSASISLFLLESLKMNPNLSSKGDPQERAINMSLLLKTFPEYFTFLSYSSPEGKIINYWLTDPGFHAKLDKFMNTLKAEDPVGKGESLVTFAARNYSLFLALFKDNNGDFQISEPASLLPFINPEYVHMVAETVKMAAKSTIIFSSEEKQKIVAQINFRYEQAAQSIRLLGAFNAQTDVQLFFRPGVVSFPKLAWRFAHMADAYSGYKASTKTKDSLNEFFANCSPISKGKTWTQIKAAKPECLTQFQTWIDSTYFDLNGNLNKANGWAKNPSRWNDRVGEHMDSFPVTSIVGNKSAEVYINKSLDYQTSFDSNFGADFKIDKQDLSIGYWGNPQSLTKIAAGLKNLYPQDLKSSFFRGLGTVTWKEVLTSSPAEPGLSVPVALKQTSINLGEKVFSFGGWPDLHPVLVLKAAGCENVVYVTRQGGDAIFGQGVFKRLTDLDGFDWNLINAKNPTLNNTGIVGENTSSWGRFYNLANPESSFSLSLKEANVVYCTNWNTLKIQDGPERMSDHGYSEAKTYFKKDQASYVRSEATAGCLN